MLLLLSCSSYSSDLIVGIWLKARREIINDLNRFASWQLHKSGFVLCRPVVNLDNFNCIARLHMWSVQSTFLSAWVLLFWPRFMLFLSGWLARKGLGWCTVLFQYKIGGMAELKEVNNSTSTDVYVWFRVEIICLSFWQIRLHRILQVSEYLWYMRPYQK
jgi:hypothetical protein